MSCLLVVRVIDLPAFSDRSASLTERWIVVPSMYVDLAPWSTIDDRDGLSRHAHVSLPQNTAMQIRKQEWTREVQGETINGLCCSRLADTESGGYVSFREGRTTSCHHSRTSASATSDIRLESVSYMVAKNAPMTDLGAQRCLKAGKFGKPVASASRRV